ncbi:MAG: hypothetical protein ACKVJ7_03530 [Candidatus Poseidoniales archaeon]
MMARKGKLASLIGLVLIGVVIANVYLGAFSPVDPPVKMNLSKLGSVSCSDESIQASVDMGMTSDCFDYLGTFGGPDIMMLIEGVALFGAGFIKMPRTGKWATRIRRISLMFGPVFIAFAIVDAFELSPHVEAEKIAVLLPYHLEPVVIQLGAFILGVFLVRGRKFVNEDDGGDKKKVDDAMRLEKERVEMDRAFSSGGSLKGMEKKSKAMDKFTTVGDLWGEMGLSAFECEFEAGLREDGDFKVERSCHICSGQGCKRCGNKGYIE